MPSSELQTEFERLVRRLLKRDGNDLYPSRDEHYARLVGVMTPEGKVYIKETVAGLHVSTPNYGRDKNRRLWSVYHWERDSGRVLSWDPDEARKVMPYLERRLVLDLLAEL